MSLKYVIIRVGITLRHRRKCRLLVCFSKLYLTPYPGEHACLLYSPSYDSSVVTDNGMVLYVISLFLSPYISRSICRLLPNNLSFMFLHSRHIPSNDPRLKLPKSTLASVSLGVSLLPLVERVNDLDERTRNGRSGARRIGCHEPGRLRTGGIY